MGISVHTGWGACVVVKGSPAKFDIVFNQIIQILGDAERFCYHRAAEMDASAAEAWMRRVRRKAVTSARKGLAAAAALGPKVCGIVAKEGEICGLSHVLASHPRMHSSEGLFYRDVLREACSIPTRIVAPLALDPSKLGKLPAQPWGRDQKLAVLAAWAASQGWAAVGSRCSGRP